MYEKLSQLHSQVKNQSDLTYKAIPFFAKIVREIRVELLTISTQQGEQISRDITDAIRLVAITEREDLNNISNYPKEVPKYLGRVKTAVLSSLDFATKPRKR